MTKRNPNPFTDRQIRFLEAIRERIRKINDPEPEVIIHESYEWHTEQTKQFGLIPKIKFIPHCSQIKSELVSNAGLLNEAKDQELKRIRQKYGIRGARNKEARLFESEWNNIMLKAKKATFTLALINQLFASNNQTVADPITLLQQIVIEEYSAQIKVKREGIYGEGKEDKTKNKEIKSYDEELAEFE